MRRHSWLWLLFPIACGETPEVVPAPIVPTVPMDRPSDPVYVEPASLTEARVQYPRFLDVETKVINRSCSPNPGVCHQGNNYPELRTAGNVLALIGARCNVEIPDPRQGWDGCEERGDAVKLGEELLELGWIEQIANGEWKVELRSPAAETTRAPLVLLSPHGDAVLEPPEEWEVMFEMTEGSKEARIRTLIEDQPFLVDYVDMILGTARGGDENRNNIFGADAAGGVGSVISPGSTEKSYLWGRITGTVPGTRMPLANQPLSNAEYIAIACFIEGLDPDGAPSALDTIDYDNCEFAKNPVEYSIY